MCVGSLGRETAARRSLDEPQLDQIGLDDVFHRVRFFADGGRATVEVVDNGVGISPDDRDKIFEPFFTTKPSGTGLGMSIVKKIVDLHAGDVVVDSAPGRGTRVRITLPAMTAVQSLAGGER